MPLDLLPPVDAQPRLSVLSCCCRYLRRLLRDPSLAAAWPLLQFLSFSDNLYDLAGGISGLGSSSIAETSGPSSSNRSPLSRVRGGEGRTLMGQQDGAAGWTEHNSDASTSIGCPFDATHRPAPATRWRRMFQALLWSARAATFHYTVVSAPTQLVARRR